MIFFSIAVSSGRFFKAGYGVPKYMLKFDGKFVFRHLIERFVAFWQRTVPFYLPIGLWDA